jgi:hypothetical protein
VNVFDSVATAIRRLPPAVRFTISAIGVASGVSAEMMTASHDHAGIPQTVLSLLCSVVAIAAFVVFLVERRGDAKSPVAMSPPDAVPVPRTRQVAGRITSLIGLACLGALATLGEWGAWIATAGGAGYAVWRTRQVVKAGKVKAGAVPHFFVVMVGGSFVFEGIGFIVAAVFQA